MRLTRTYDLFNPEYYNKFEETELTEDELKETRSYDHFTWLDGIGKQKYFCRYAENEELFVYLWKMAISKSGNFGIVFKSSLDKNPLKKRMGF